MSFFTKFFIDYNAQALKKFHPIVEQINNLEEEIKVLSDETLAGQTEKFKKRLAGGETLDDILPEAFATVREVSRRTLGQRHFDVQLLGGIVLHKGNIAEMKTGEGKTLVATLPTYLNALVGEGVHVVTVNDYLSRRDATWMGQIYAFLGLSVGVISQESSYLYDSSHTATDEQRDKEGSFNVFYEFLRPANRGEAYQADITYGTNNEFGFDYLRDNLAYNPNGVVQRSDKNGKYPFAVIDEVDSILIDESRTPLIISAPVAESENLYAQFASIAGKLKSPEDYTVDEKLKTISLTDDGISKAEQVLGVENIYTDKGIKYVHHLETAVRAKALFEKDRHYVVKDDEVVIVDEFTGRLQPGRRWSEGLHQAIEAREGVRIKEESRTFATVTYQNYFRLYKKLSGMTGTGMTSKEEFLKVYGLDTFAIPTHRDPQRQDKADLIFQTEHGKFLAIADTVKKLQEDGQPVLIGTVSIEKNELLSKYLTKTGVKHDLLNAKNHEQEGAIVANAGKKGAVVIATNMAGRGVDIKLGGATPTKEEQEEVKALGGLFVLGTERHEARRIDNQLRGRSGRQGDPGATQFFVSLEDSLMRVFASDRIKNMMGKFGIPEEQPIENRMITKAIENAQSKIEGMNFDMRKHLLEYDDVVNHQRITMYDRRRKVLLGQKEAMKDFLEKAIAKNELTESEAESFWQAVEKKETEMGPEAYWENVRRVILQVIDMFWVEHLEAIDYMKGSVRLRAYGQRDPLVEFKKEGLRLFKDLEVSVFAQTIKLVPNIGAEVRAEQKPLQEIHRSVRLIGGNGDGGRNNTKKQEGAFAKVGRNDPCPCGSGKKYKKCHGA